MEYSISVKSVKQANLNKSNCRKNGNYDESLGCQGEE